MSIWQQTAYFLRHSWQAVPRNHIDSPFVHDFIQNVMSNTGQYYAFQSIEGYRKKLLANRDKLTVEDLGAGSKRLKGRQRIVADITRNSLITPKYGQLLFHLMRHYQYRHALELGTSLGISAAYMAAVSGESTVISMEGSREIAAMARKTWEDLGLKNCSVVTGNFDTTLQEVLATSNTFDLIFIDGNHRYQPTVDYFQQCLPKLSSNGVIILDDIHWSAEMHQAWNDICAQQTTGITIDLYHKGLVFPGVQKQGRQKFILRY